jgi:hypothetical protein
MTVCSGSFFQARAAFDARRRAAGKRRLRCERGVVAPDDDELQVPVAHEPIPVFDHRRDLVAGVDVDERKGDVTKKRLPGQPEHDRRVFADTPEHGKARKAAERFPEDVDRLVFERRQMVAVHDARSTAAHTRARASPPR